MSSFARRSFSNANFSIGAFSFSPDTHDGGYDIEDVSDLERRRKEELQEFKSARERLHQTIELAFDEHFAIPGAAATREIVRPYVSRFESGMRYIDWKRLEDDVQAQRTLLALQEQYQQEYEMAILRRAMEEDDDDAIFVL